MSACSSQVVTTSSGTASYGRIRFADLQWQRRYSPNLSYAQSKLADLMLFQHLAALTTAHHPLQAGADGEGEQALAHVIGDLAHRDC
jgi:hypothetical protein